MKQRLRDLEARDNWIQARVDELISDENWLVEMHNTGKCCIADSGAIKYVAKQQATREHASIIADLEEAIIDSMEVK